MTVRHDEATLTIISSIYTSVGRYKVLPDLNVEWVMAVASDAKGWLPMWIQKMALPGAIVKDVGLFTKWTAENRARNSN